PTGIDQGDQHVGGDDTGLYLHKGASWLGEAADKERQGKSERGVEFVKAALNDRFGQGFSDTLFHYIAEEKPRNLREELALELIKRMVRRTPEELSGSQQANSQTIQTMFGCHWLPPSESIR